MSVGAPPSRPFTVFIRFSVSPADQEELMEMVTTMIMEIGPFLASQNGFRGFKCLRSLDGQTVINYLEWDSQADHEACMGNPEMEAAGGPLMEWVEAGRANLDVEMFQQVSNIAG